MQTLKIGEWPQQVAASVLKGLRAGRAAWLPGTAVMGTMPFDPTVSDGSSRVFGALSAVWLSTQAIERGLADPRWMTIDEISGLGGRVRRGEKATQVSVLRSESIATAMVSGMPVERRVVATRPEAVIAHVFNAGQTIGLGHYVSPAPPVNPEKVLLALPARMGLAIGNTADIAMLVAQVRKDLLREKGHGSPAVQSLSDALAVWMLARRLGSALPDTGQASQVQNWCVLLEQDPLALAQAARVAARVMQRVVPQIVAIEKEARMERDQEMVRQPKANQLAATREKLRFVSREAGDGRVFLHTPKREDVERVKALGARWDKGSKLWYVPAGKPVAAFEPWIAQGVMSCGINPGEVKLAFAEACRNLGLVLRAEIQETKNFVRCGVEGRRPRLNDGSYKLSGLHTGKPHGFIKNFYTGQELAWSFDMPQLTDEQRAILEKQSKEIAEKQAREQAETYELRAEELVAEFSAARTDEKALANHPYLQRKQVAAYGIRVNARNELMIPLRDVDDKMWTYQRIGPREGGKKLLAENGKCKGMFHLVGVDSVDEVKKFPALLYAEGYATAATLHQATGLPVAMTVSAGNIEPVVAKLKKALPEISHIICADNDLWFPERVRESMMEKGLVLQGTGELLPVESGPGRVRHPIMDGCQLDGVWHTVSGGRYCVAPERVNGVVVALGGAVENAAGVQSPIALGNTGVKTAREAADRHGAAMVVPVFDETRPGRPTDFNDLAVVAGVERVRQQIMNQLAGRMPVVSTWLKVGNSVRKSVEL